MPEFHTSLVREKIIFDQLHVQNEGDKPCIITGNRIDLKLEKQNISERVIVRAQNMHSALRLAAKIFMNFYKISGPLVSDVRAPDWDALWRQSLSRYENEFNSDHIWGAIYIHGTPVFKTKNEPFMDVIEQCALVSRENYDGSGDIAEKMLLKLGHEMKVTQSNNVSATFTDKEDGLRGGIMHRTTQKNMIFNFSMAGGQSRVDRIHHGFLLAAAFLELFNLKFLLELRQKQLAEKTVSAHSFEAEQMHATVNRQMMLNREILSFESLYQINYRPERPNLYS